jgi:hypothetical protein
MTNIKGKDHWVARAEVNILNFRVRKVRPRPLNTNSFEEGFPRIVFTIYDTFVL